MSAKQRPAQMCRQQCTHRCTCAAGRWCFTPDYCCDARRRGTQTAARWTVVTDGRPQHRCAGAHRLTAPRWPGSCVSGGVAVLQEWCLRSSFVQLQPPDSVLVDPEHPRSFFMPQTVEVRDVVLKPLHLLSAGQVSVHQANDADRGLRDCPTFGEVLPDPGVLACHNHAMFVGVCDPVDVRRGGVAEDLRDGVGVEPLLAEHLRHSNSAKAVINEQARPLGSGRSPR